MSITSSLTRQRSKASQKDEEATLGVSRTISDGPSNTLQREITVDDVYTRSWNRFMRKGKKQIPVGESFKNFFFSSILNVLLLAIPVSWAGHFLGLDIFTPPVEFAMCFIALLPLAKLLEFGGEQMGFYTGKDIGDFIAVSLNNAIEATLAIILLLKCELRLLQSTIIGIVSLHLLLIPGFAFFTGGARIMEQELHPHLAQLNHTLLTIGVLTLLLPAAFFAAGGNLAALSDVAEEATKEAANSTGEAISNITDSAAEAVNATGEAIGNAIRAVIRAVANETAGEAAASVISEAATSEAAKAATKTALLQMSRGLAVLLLLVYICSRIYLHDPPGDEDSLHQHKDAPKELKEEELRLATVDPEVNQFVCIGMMVVVLAIMAVTAEFLVDSIEPLREHHNVHEEWFGLVLLPLVSFSADGMVAVIRFISHQIGRPQPPTTMAKAQAIDLSVQFLLFWLPFLVLLAWWTHKPLFLLFDLFEVAVIIGACFIVNYVTADAKTNYAEGFAMVAYYLMIVVVSWFYEGQIPIKEFLLCPGQELE